MRDPHSVYVGMLVDFGLVGLALYCGLLVAFWKRIGEDPDNLRRALVRGLFWAYVATGFFDTYWRHSQVGWYMGYLFYLFITPRGQVVAASWTRRRGLPEPVKKPLPGRHGNPQCDHPAFVRGT